MLQPLSEYLFTGRFALAVGLGGFVTRHYINSCLSVQALAGMLLRVSCIAVVGCYVPSCSQGADSMPAPM